jgi:hypothetical protein
MFFSVSVYAADKWKPVKERRDFEIDSNEIMEIAYDKLAKSLGKHFDIEREKKNKHYIHSIVVPASYIKTTFMGKGIIENGYTVHDEKYVYVMIENRRSNEPDSYTFILMPFPDRQDFSYYGGTRIWPHEANINEHIKNVIDSLYEDNL